MTAHSAKFDVGQVIVTPSASRALEASGQSPDAVLQRHQSGDWGDVSDQERQVNEEALRRSYNLLSIYRTPAGERVTIVTKGDRTLTLVHIDPRH
jgi:hypothetical protein